MPIQSVERELQNVTASISSLLAAFVAVQNGVAPENQIFEYLQVAGGTSRDLNVNAQAAIQTFEYEVPEGRTARIERLNFTATASAKENVTGFLNLPALGLGLLIEVRDPDDVVVQTFGTDLVPITRHADLAALAGVDVLTEQGVPNSFRFQCRWTLAKAGAPQRLVAGSRIVVTVRDDIDDTDILSFRAMVQGVFLS